VSDDETNPFEDEKKTKKESLSTQESKLSFENTKSIMVSMLLTGDGKVSEASLKSGITLQSTIDNTDLVGFKPTHVDITTIHPEEKNSYIHSIVNLEFEVSGAAILPNAGADTNELGYQDEHITLHLKIEKDEVVDSKSGNPYEISEPVVEELKTSHLFMSLPKETMIDDEIKDKVKEDHSGTEKDVTDLESEGDEHEKIAEGKEDDHDETLHMCECVNGTCLPMKKECDKCHDGWHGKRCDLPKDEPLNKEDEIKDEVLNQETIKRQLRLYSTWCLLTSILEAADL